MEWIIASIIIGCIAGFLAGKIMKGEGYGCLLNTVLGIIGSKALDIFDIEWGGLVGQVGTAVIGAVLVLWIAALFKK